MGNRKDKEFIDRVKLLIKYSLNETYSENLKKINEQVDDPSKKPSSNNLTNRVGKFVPPWEIEAKRQKKESEQQEKKVREFKEFQKSQGCASPERTIIPGRNSAGVEGMEALPEGMCAYPAPFPCELRTSGEYARDIQQSNSGTFSTIFIPPIGHNYVDDKGITHVVKDVKIYFFDNLGQWMETIFKPFAGSNFSSEEAENLAIDKFLKMVPLGTVWTFEITEVTQKWTGNYKQVVPGTLPGFMDEKEYSFIDETTNVYTPFMRTGSSCGHGENDNQWKFGWYWTEKNKGEYKAAGDKRYTAYPQISFTDNRDLWDKLVDEYGFKAQLILTGIYVLGGIFVPGAQWLLWLEILSEGTLGLIMAERDLEKGHNIDAAFDLLFAALPLLKTQKWFGAVTNEDALKVIRSMKKYRLDKQSSFKDVAKWYLRAPEEVQNIFRQMGKIGDEWSEAKIIKEIEAAIFQKIASEPNLLKRIEWYKNIHIKEALLYLGSTGFNLALNAVYGQQLNDLEKMRYSGIHANLSGFSEDLAAQFTAKALEDPLTTKENLNTNLAKVLSQPGLTGSKTFWEKSVEQVTTKDSELGYENQKMDTKQIKKLQKEGYIEDSQLKPEQIPQVDHNSVIKVNGLLYFKLKGATPEQDTPK